MAISLMLNDVNAAWIMMASSHTGCDLLLMQLCFKSTSCANALDEVQIIWEVQHIPPQGLDSMEGSVMVQQDLTWVLV